MTDTPEFERGQLVRLQSHPDQCGAVIEVSESGPEVQYTVLLGGKTRKFFASQLVADEQGVESGESLSADECRALLTARYINHPGTSTLYSLNAARIDFIAYQFRPVLRFIRADRPRLSLSAVRCGGPAHPIYPLTSANGHSPLSTCRSNDENCPSITNGTVSSLSSPAWQRDSLGRPGFFIRSND